MLNMKLDLRLFFLFAVAFGASSTPYSAVYKWTDAEGNVHFSDRPVDQDKATEVDVELVNKMDGATIAEMAEARKRREEASAEAEKRQSELAASQPKQEDPCKEALEDYRKLSGITVTESGRRELHYLTDEDGKAISAKAQQEEVKKLERQLRARGCM